MSLTIPVDSTSRHTAAQFIEVTVSEAVLESRIWSHEFHAHCKFYQPQVQVASLHALVGFANAVFSEFVGQYSVYSNSLATSVSNYSVRSLVPICLCFSATQ